MRHTHPRRARRSRAVPAVPRMAAHRRRPADEQRRHLEFHRRQGDELLGLRRPAAVRHRARGGARAHHRVLRLDRHRAVHLALCAQTPRGHAQLHRRHSRGDPVRHLRPVGRPCARPGNLSVLELDRRASRMDPHLRRPGLEPAAHRGDGGTRARHHDPADHHVDHARHLPADPQAA